MKRIIKDISLLGGVAVLSLGFFVSVLTNNALAIEITKPASSSDVKVKVTVKNDYPTIDIAGPLDGATFIGKTFSVKAKYTDATNLRYELIYVAEDGSKTSYDLPEKVLSTRRETGTDVFEVDVSDYGGKYGNYILRAKAFGNGSSTDMVNFNLTAFSFEIKGLEQETKNPIITIFKGPGAKVARIQVVSNNGEAVFGQPIEVELNSDHDTDVTLPLAKFGLAEGNYRIIVTPYDENGEKIDASKEITVKYTPAAAPEVPETGFAAAPNTGFITGTLGLSSEDAVSTGLALLLISVIFGILVIFKKKREEEKR